MSASDILLSCSWQVDCCAHQQAARGGGSMLFVGQLSCEIPSLQLAQAGRYLWLSGWLGMAPGPAGSRTPSTQRCRGPIGTSCTKKFYWYQNASA